MPSTKTKIARARHAGEPTPFLRRITGGSIHDLALFSSITLAFAVVILIGIALSLLLCSCDGSIQPADNYTESDDELMVVVERHGHCKILVDRGTRVEYILYRENSDTNYATAGLSVRLDESGEPMKWNGDL